MHTAFPLPPPARSARGPGSVGETTPGACSTPAGFSTKLNMNKADKENVNNNWDNISGFQFQNTPGMQSQSQSQLQLRGAASASAAINATRPAVRHTRFAVHGSQNAAFKEYNRLGNVAHKDNVRLNNGYASRTQHKMKMVHM